MSQKDGFACAFMDGQPSVGSKQARAIRPTHHFLQRRHEMYGVNGATDTVTNANPPPRNPDADSCKEANKFKETMDGSTTSNDSSKQSQGTSNSYQLPLATKPPINLAILAKPAPAYTGETAQPHPEVDAVSSADAAPEGAKKVPAYTTQ
jgi:hypothetical protein